MNKIAHIRRQFADAIGHAPALARPRTFNEKIQWLKLFHHHPLLPRIADKIAMKAFVAERVGAKHVIPTLATYDRAEDFDPLAITAPFVLKLNNGSGEVLFVPEPRAIDLQAIRARLDEWLRPARNHFFYSAEWCYRDIPSRIIAEPVIAPPAELVDYKIFCFSGEPRLVMLCSERPAGLKVDFFDPLWNRLPFRRHYPNSAAPLPRPSRLDEMLDLAARLSGGLPFLRVDLYAVAGETLVGELTPYPGNGMEAFEPFEWDERLGDWLGLPEEAIIHPRSGGGATKIRRVDLAALLDDLDDFPSPGTTPTRADHSAREAKIARLADKVRRMETSFSWRVTAPLRALRRALEKPGAPSASRR